MTVAAIVVAAALLYVVGVAATLIIVGRGDAEDCEAEDDVILAAMWPLVLAVLVATAPFVCMFVAGRWLARRWGYRGGER